MTTRALRCSIVAQGGRSTYRRRHGTTRPSGCGTTGQLARRGVTTLARRAPRRGANEAGGHRSPACSARRRGAVRGRPAAAGPAASPGGELDDIALEAADDALMSVLRRLDDFRGASRFTTWVYKFALLEAAVKLRKRAWQGREIPLEPESWNAVLEHRPGAGRRGRAERAAGDPPAGDRGDPDPAPATRARRACSQRRADRRACRPARHHARRALQVAARCTPASCARHLDACGLSVGSLPGGDDVTERPDRDHATRPAARPVRAGGRLRRLLRRSSTATSSSSSRAKTPTPRSPGCAPHLAGCPACREEYESLRALVGGDQPI